jgi:hypothetical protein
VLLIAVLLLLLLLLVCAAGAGVVINNADASAFTSVSQCTDLSDSDIQALSGEARVALKSVTNVIFGLVQCHMSQRLVTVEARYTVCFAPPSVP